MRTLVVAPTLREARMLSGDVLAARSPDAVLARLAQQPADVVLIAGICGGLDPSLAPGALVLSRRLVACGRPDLAPPDVLVEAARRALRTLRRPFVSSTLLSVDQPLATRRGKTDAWNTHGAAGVDMETYTLAEALAGRGVPWLALRAVLDPASAALPTAVAGWRGEQDERAIARAALRRPFDWPAYVRLALQSRTALGALARAVPAVVRAIDEIQDLAQAPSPDAAQRDLPIIAVR
ncbi:MAG: hypothetical protein KGK07_10005 [Chloroflexota bacterium]|nr:hypothetical protein [Chloroflexota bacterium]